ncbi:response regulator [Undibacterium sp. KW1]|uniref:response regulator transcription factor n=1 Tax=Undibacterium sp. KW1 TaxID=2058624 RepID=UPI001331D249|nr:response regulator [Undibacterium sp. KW1]BBB62752.1 response regulator [Undibacterium sp. KW1]
MGNTSTWIAVVDDEEGIRRSLLRLLRSAGLEAHAFVSGKVFLGSLESRQPACVLLDLHMLDMSGFAVIAQLAQIAPELPVVILTGQEVSEKQRNADLAHALAVLQKPVDDQELFAAITSALIKKDKQPLYHSTNPVIAK